MIVARCFIGCMYSKVLHGHPKEITIITRTMKQGTEATLLMLGMNHFKLEFILCYYRFIATSTHEALLVIVGGGIARG